MYWCHMCNRRVDPLIELEIIECPLCQSGFIEQMSHTNSTANEPNSDNALSLWAPVLLGMMSNSRRRRRFRYENNNNNDILSGVDEDSELDRELQSFIRTRRRNSATILQFLQRIRSESNNNSENLNGNSERDTIEIRDRDRVILINSLNQTIILQSGNYRDWNNNNNNNSRGSLNDYFVGSGLDLLMQHLDENDPNRYGTPPAKKEDIDAMPIVKIGENVQCSVCLDDLEMGSEAKEMPCQHQFHSGCILPWLELHSSCPVCRYQLPCDGDKIDNSDGNANINNNNNINSSYIDDNGSGVIRGSNNEDRGNNVERINGRSENWRGFMRRFSNLFSSSRRRGSTSSSSANASRNVPSTDEN